MGKVDLVLVGSEAVVESGGLVNAVGSYQIALIAKAANVPFYALAERWVVSVGTLPSPFSHCLSIAINFIGCSRCPNMTFRPIPTPYLLSLYPQMSKHYGPVQSRMQAPLVTSHRDLLLNQLLLQITHCRERHIPP